MTWELPFAAVLVLLIGGKWSYRSYGFLNGVADAKLVILFGLARFGLSDLRCTGRSTWSRAASWMDGETDYTATVRRLYSPYYCQ